MEENHEKALKKVENLRLEFVKVSHTFKTANDQFSTIFNQTMDIESRVCKINKRIDDGERLSEKKWKV